MVAQGRAVLFYDGVCGLCHRLVYFIVRHDSKGRIHFAALQSDFSAKMLSRHGKDPRDLDTVYLLTDVGTPSEHLWLRSRAVAKALVRLGGVFRLAALSYVVPSPLADLAYRLIARLRYRIFGRFDACPLPPPELRQRFVDLDVSRDA